MLEKVKHDRHDFEQQGKSSFEFLLAESDS